MRMTTKLTLLLGLGSCVCAAEDSANGFFLRRKGFETPSELLGKDVGDSSDSQHDEEDVRKLAMGDLWERATAAAQIEMEAERLLWRSSSVDMSMPTRPPAPRPTPAPIGPTPAPIPKPPTPAPGGPTDDCLKGRTREEYIFDLLVPITPGSILNDPSTPQGMAFDYLAYDDPYLEDPCTATTIEQRYGLTTLYFSTQGQEWTETENWLGPQQECTWFGVSCLHDPAHASKLLLPNNNLVGSVPDEISTLDGLSRLDLFFNSITGTIPNGISKLTNLILLDLEQNLISGLAFPDAIFDLQSLIAYRISTNFVSGSIPREIGNLQSLEQLWVATTQLTGTIPTQIGDPLALESIFLYENQLIGTLPPQIGNLANLEDLRVYSNTLQETIPKELFLATGLVSLRLEFNFFSGTIPSELGNLVNLKDFRLDQNSLSGPLPQEIGGLTSLENLIVHTNFLSGEIPNVFNNLNQLDFLDASNNLFFGTIPETVFSLPSIRLIYLSNNTLSGTIPPGFSQPPSLRDLYLDGNGLIGTIPPIVPGQLLDLNEFLVQFNFLSGSMPSEICDLRSNEGNLDDLFADCGGSNPEIQCSYPQCCNRCYEGGNFARRRQRRARESSETGLALDLQALPKRERIIHPLP